MADYDRYGRDSRGQYQGERARREDTDYRSGGYGEYVDRPRGRDRDDDRGFVERAGDEVRSWFGDDDRQRGGSDRRGYSGDGFGGRAYGSDRDRAFDRDRDDRVYRSSGDDHRSSDRGGLQGRAENWLDRQDDRLRHGRDEQPIGGRAAYDRNYGEDRQGWRSGGREGDRGYQNRFGGQSGYGGDDGYRQAGQSQPTSFTGSDYRQQGWQGGYGQDQSFGRTQDDRSGYGGQIRSSQGDTGRTPNQSAYGSYGGEGRYDAGPRTDMAGPGAYSQSPTGGAFGQTGFQAARDMQSSYGGGGSSSSYGERRVENERSNSDERGFFERASDEVRSWFGDEDAERRRERDQSREDARDAYKGSDGRRTGDASFAGATGSSSSSSNWAHDPHYHEYRSQRAAELDRDYDEYKKHRSSQFGQDFASWRTSRTSGAAALGGAAMGASGSGDSKGVREHQRVLSKDGEPVGAVDKVQGADIKLTRKDSTDGKHHLIPLSWVDRVDGHDVHLTKTADEVRREWREAPEQPQGQAGQLNSSLAGSLQKGQDTATSATSGAYATTGATTSGAV